MKDGERGRNRTYNLLIKSRGFRCGCGTINRSHHNNLPITRPAWTVFEKRWESWRNRTKSNSKGHKKDTVRLVIQLREEQPATFFPPTTVALTALHRARAARGTSSLADVCRDAAPTSSSSATALRPVMDSMRMRKKSGAIAASFDLKRRCASAFSHHRCRFSNSLCARAHSAEYEARVIHGNCHSQSRSPIETGVAISSISTQTLGFVRIHSIFCPKVDRT